MKVVIVVVDLKLSVKHSSVLTSLLKESFEGSIVLIPVVMEDINPTYYKHLTLSNDGYRGTGSIVGFAYTASIDDKRAVNKFIGQASEGIILAIQSRKPYANLEVVIHHSSEYADAVGRMTLLIESRELGGTMEVVSYS